MPFWRRERPLHERLAQEAGLDFARDLPHRPRQPWPEVGIHGIHRQREWDAVVAVDAAGPEGDELGFVALRDGTILVESEADLPEDELEAFAGALESQVEPPYRAIGIRKGERQWALAARALEVVELDSDPGEEIELAVHAGERTLLIDGARSFGTIAELEALLGATDGVVRARRLDGPLFEISVSPL